MANNAHLEQLRQGVANWNAWRRDNPYLEPDLSAADLREINLNEANLGAMNLNGADLRGAALRFAYFPKAKLNGALLAGAKLRGANLREAQLDRADLFRRVSSPPIFVGRNYLKPIWCAQNSAKCNWWARTFSEQT
jgi:uncharacterized protein YjbI with pentapeptide repeats